MKTIIVSGFELFGDYLVNASQLVAQRISRTTIQGFRIHTLLFEASISRENRGQRLLQIATAVKADGVISIGMASGKTGLCIETVATNRIYNEKYVPSGLQNTSVDGCRAYLEKINLNLGAWNTSVFQEVCQAESIPVMPPSIDAGGFCCNQLMYQWTVSELTTTHQLPFIFLHIPCCSEAVPDIDAFLRAGKKTMAVSQVVRGLQLLLENALL